MQHTAGSFRVGRRKFRAAFHEEHQVALYLSHALF
eukprot:CAMPEP_0184517368 /NCGR_PEP_ID=MMETSP0198_2-20121128/5523_1 /TAXON_ID=1112570 /ORGANISM="Thraustochytrium sp., Strain LLF1b" /LENGTH=34 /DNA_ID= /DNA_START= /DNA_END= /DNA_ORIENTATION=